jgi:uncharacterized protein (TIGR02611 family)
VLGRLKNDWRRLARAPAGTRFRGLHRAHQRRRRRGSSRVWTVTAGLAIMSVGVVALPAPGPGTLVIILGAALVARESATVARVLDWLELRLRRAVEWCRAVWRGAPPVGKVMAALAGLGLAGAAVLVAYSVLVG